MLRVFPVAVFLFGTPLLLSAQYLDSFQNPPGIEWKRIETAKYELVFPSEITHDARRVADMLEHMHARVGRSIGADPPRITLLLSNRTTNSNGYVTLGPRYSEWFTTPPQSTLLGTNDWFSLLAMHEIRHVAQFDRLKSGATGVASFLFGDAAWSFLSFWSVPTWVWEGDAVGIETALSRSGRGRMPEFDRDIRAQVLSGEFPSYYAAYLGSYRNWHPSVYHLGYLITTHTRRAHGEAEYANILRRSANWSFFPWAYSMTANAETGRTAAELYNDAMLELKELWTAQLAAVEVRRGTKMNLRAKSCWTGYSFPKYLGDGSLVALKMGMEDRYAFVRLDRNGDETQLLHPALYGEPFGARDTKIVWSEQVPDLRWGKVDRTVLHILNTQNGDTRTLEGTGTMFSPALSPDASRLAVVDFPANRNCAIVILDVESGKEIKRIPNPARDMIQTPAWTPDGLSIVYVRVPRAGGKALTKFEISNAAREDLLPLGDEDVSAPSVGGGFLFFASPRSGIDNIYALDLSTRAQFQVTSARYGASSPSVSDDGRRLSYAMYTANGFDIEEVPVDSGAWTNAWKIQDGSIRYCEPLVLQEGGAVAFDSIPSREWAVSDVGPIAGLLNVHSMMLLPQSSLHDWSIALSSLNAMNTLGLEAGASYNFNERAGAVFADASYAGLFPVLSIGGSHGLRTSVLTSAVGDPVDETWKETTARVGVRLPLNLSRGIYSARFTLGAEARYTKISSKLSTGAWEVNNGEFSSLVYRFTASAGYGWIRDIHPRWGQSLTLSFHHTPFPMRDYAGRLFSAEGSVYFPGLVNAHSVWLRGGYEAQDAENYRFASEILFPRGYSARFHETLAELSVNYTLPLFYPDVNAWSLLYLKRVRATLFHEYAEGRNGSTKRIYHSSGFELLFDTNFFTLPIEIPVGVRISYMHTSREWRQELLIGV